GPELPADDTRGDALRIVWEGAIPPFAGKLPFLTEQRGLVWRTDGKLLSRGGANELARWADVYVRSEEPILDDPSVAMFLRYGVVSIQRSPLRSLPTRIVEAARARRAGRFVPISGSPRESLAGALSRDLEATGSHEEEREAPVKLGVVVPFGGLSTSQLARTMASAQRGARLGLEWVIAHQRHGGIKSDGAWEDEVREVDDVAFRYKATVRRHSVNGPWNLSAARNAGTCALSDEVTHVLFLDSDLQVRPGFLMSVLDELRSNPMVVVVPFVLNMPSEESRIGSGVATYPVAKLREAGGFDTGYVGWGYEDLDMLSRVRDLGVPSILLHRGADKGSALLIHEDHAPRWEETRGASCERYTSKGKMMSAGGPVDQPTRERSEA
ncbi:glycosyltransferase, partial [Patescibacteria group bacterium]|nr:glycosyltransferase [Patescibacteria group bacterium]